MLMAPSLNSFKAQILFKTMKQTLDMKYSYSLHQRESSSRKICNDNNVYIFATQRQYIQNGENRN